MLDAIISLFRDGLSGTRYIIYVLVCLTLLFAVVGYMFKQKYGKVEFKMSSGTAEEDSEVSVTSPKKEKKVKKAKKEKKSKNETKSVTKTPTPQVAPKVATTSTTTIQTPQPAAPVTNASLQQQAIPTPSIPDASKVTSIPEPTPIAKTPVQASQTPVPTGTLQQPTALPDLGEKKTGNPVIDDDITTII